MTDTTRPGDPADKAIDAKADGAFQGSHRAGYGDRLARVEEWLRKHPSATLGSGEGAVLLAEIDRLRAAIDRVRALHRLTLEGAHCAVCHSSDSSDWDFYSCPTLRALDGEDA
jgi:hypothetical protein